MKGKLIVYRFNDELSKSEKVMLHRKLHTYIYKQQKGGKKYQYTISGFFDQRHHVYLGSRSYILRPEDITDLKRILRGKASYSIRDVVLKESDKKILYPRKYAKN